MGEEEEKDKGEDEKAVTQINGMKNFRMSLLSSVPHPVRPPSCLLTTLLPFSEFLGINQSEGNIWVVPVRTATMGRTKELIL